MITRTVPLKVPKWNLPSRAVVLQAPLGAEAVVSGGLHWVPPCVGLRGAWWNEPAGLAEQRPDSNHR